MSDIVEPKVFVARLKRDDSYMSRAGKRWQQILTVICSGSVMASLGLAVGALVRHELTCLVWAALGVAIWAVIAWLTSKYHRRRKPAEGAVVTIDILKEQVQRGRLPAPPDGKGTVSWVTEKGVYIGSNYIPWQDISYPYVSSNNGESILRLYNTLTPTKNALFKVWAVIGALFLPVVMEMLVAVLGFRFLGTRDDVLCSAFASVMLLSLTMILVLLTLSLKRRTLEFSVSLQNSSIAELQLFVTKKTAGME